MRRIRHRIGYHASGCNSRRRRAGLVGFVGRQWAELALFDAGDDLHGSRDPDSLLDLVHAIVDEAPLQEARAAARQEALDRAMRALEVARCPVCRRRDPARERQATWWMGLGCAAIGLPWLALLVLGRVAWSDAGARWAVVIAVVGSAVGVATVWGQVAPLERAEKIRLTPRPSRAAGP